MHLFIFAALASLFVVVANAESDPNCSSVATVFVTVTATPVTKTVSIPFEVSQSVTSRYAVPPKVQVALDSSTDITATSTDYITLIHVVTTIPKLVASAGAEKGPYYFTADNGTTVWLDDKSPPAGIPLSTSTAVVTIQPIPPSSRLSSGGSPDPTSYSTVFLTVISKVYRTETITETALAVTTSSAVTVSSSISLTSSYTASLASTVPLNEVPSEPTASLIAITSSKPFARLGMSGWNATSRTLLKENLVSSANEPVKLLSQQTGPKDASYTRPGTESLAAQSCSGNVTNNISARQLGLIVTATIDGVVVSWKNMYDGAASTIPAPVDNPTTVALQPHRGVTPVEHPIVPVQVTPTSSSALRNTPSFEPPGTQAGIATQQASVLTDIQNKAVLYSSNVQQSAQATIVTSVIPVVSAFPTSSIAASRSRIFNTSRTSESTLTATPSCTGRANFTIDFDDLPRFSTSGQEVDIPPIFNPYRKLFFENHYGYVPPPSDPFPPHSPPQLAVYRANQGINVDGSPDAGLESAGEFGAGPRSADSTYWIDAFSLWIGCENVGPSDCVITINGYDSARSTRAVSQTITQPPCPGLVNCKLTFVEFKDDFRNLAGIQILTAVDRKFMPYYIDDVSLGWSNNTCAAQKRRSSAQ
ncbi:hypothetical protein MMC07_005421 [Pseudocyphellaria aurata]|nr:hypothetical protein [Pseudocyphellaria aurata]